MRLYVVMTCTPHPDGEFVELEDEHGRSHGANIGAEWSKHPTAPALYRLGPFVPVPEHEHEAEVGRLHETIAELGRLAAQLEAELERYKQLRNAGQALFSSWMSGSGTADQGELYDALDRALGGQQQGAS